MSSEAYRDGWERIFNPKPPVVMHRCPFPLRRGMQIELTLPSDLKLADLRRLVWYLVTMCDDWDVDGGFPSFAWPERPAATVVSLRDVSHVAEPNVESVSDSRAAELWAETCGSDCDESIEVHVRDKDGALHKFTVDVEVERICSAFRHRAPKAPLAQSADDPQKTEEAPR